MFVRYKKIVILLDSFKLYIMCGLLLYSELNSNMCVRR